MAKPRTGRPPLLNRKVAEEIIGYVAAGNYRRVAAGAAGVAPRTLTHWMDYAARYPRRLLPGEEGQPKDVGMTYGQFRHRLVSAERRAEIRMVAVLQTAGKKDWKAAVAYLERKAPQRWSKTRNMTKGAAPGLDPSAPNAPGGGFSVKLNLVVKGDAPPADSPFLDTTPPPEPEEDEGLEGDEP